MMSLIFFSALHLSCSLLPHLGNLEANDGGLARQQAVLCFMGRRCGGACGSTYHTKKVYNIGQESPRHAEPRIYKTACCITVAAMAEEQLLMDSNAIYVAEEPTLISCPIGKTCCGVLGKACYPLDSILKSSLFALPCATLYTYCSCLGLVGMHDSSGNMNHIILWPPCPWSSCVFLGFRFKFFSTSSDAGYTRGVT
jgi:hypothetical protein